MLLNQLSLKNLLSFGDSPCVVPLRPLNVLIGPNGSGKSNFIDAIALLQTAPREYSRVIRDGGGAEEWGWKGNRNVLASIEAIVDAPRSISSITHQMSFWTFGRPFELAGERIATATCPSNKSPEFEYDALRGSQHAIIQNGTTQPFNRDDKEFDFSKSILAQRRDPEKFPAITYLAQQYETIQIYREWSFGRYTPVRLPQRTTERNDRLLEDFSNLGMMINRLRGDLVIKQRLLESLNGLYPGIDDVDVSVVGGTIEVFFLEGKSKIPATRLSDGTLRFLCLLVILLQPTPPPLVCIEEPEMGLHPDVLPGLADLLRDASQRMQLVVTTHSDILVDALSEVPEDIIVCEKQDGATMMKRLNRDDLAVWLEKYSLGQLWLNGHLGGNRW